MKNKADNAKSLQITSLCYSIAPSALYVLLTLIKLEKNKNENSSFVCLLSSYQSYGVCEQ